MKPQKIEIDFNTTAGNFYIKDALGFGYPFLDPNSDFGKAVVDRYNSYEEMQQRIAQLEEALKMITKGAEMASHEFDDPNDATEAFSYLNICIEKAKSLLK